MTRPLAYRVPADVLRPPPNFATRSAEQDAAAGGREGRRVILADGGEATASVRLRKATGRRVYAYLQFKYKGQNYALYIGDSSAMTREEALRLGWLKAVAKGMTTEPLTSKK